MHEEHGLGLEGVPVTILNADDHLSTRASLLIYLHLLITNDECLARPMPFEAGGEATHFKAETVSR